MLTLLKIILFFLAIVGLTWGAGILLEAEGAVRIAAGGMEFTLGPLQLVIAAALAVLAIWLLLKVLGLVWALLLFLNGDETALRRSFRRRRHRKGLDALGDAMLALASGEGKEAQSKAETAERYLDRPDLTQLLIAQGAEMTGDRARAANVYKGLVTKDRTRFVGVRGLLKQKLDEGDTDTAMALAERAFALKPRHEETQDTLLRLQAARQDWSGARETLGAKRRHGQLPRDVHRRRDAVLAIGAATGTEGAAQRDSVLEANRHAPQLIPGALMAARAEIAAGHQRPATRILKKAWESQPHPDLAAAFAEIVPDEDPQARLDRFQTLTRLKPDHPETRMLLAELNIAAGNFPEARRKLGDLPTRHPTTRALTIMAAIERGEGATDAVVRGWLTRALSASRGPRWVCQNCHVVHGEWSPVCSNCGALDTMSWTTPPETARETTGRDDMLPLIVGPDEDRTDKAPVIAETAPVPTPVVAPEEVAAAGPTATGVPEAEIVDDAAPASGPDETAPTDPESPPKRTE